MFVMYSLLSIVSLLVIGVRADVLHSLNYRSIVNTRVTIDGYVYNVAMDNYPCYNSNSTFKTIYFGDPDVRCSCFGNCTLPEDCYMLETKIIGTGKLIIGTDIKNVHKVSYSVRDLESLSIFQPPLDYTLPEDYSIYCFDDKEFGAVISDETFKFLFDKRKYKFEYISEKVLINFVARDFMFHTVRDQFVPDLPIILKEFIFSCFNYTDKVNSFPSYDCNVPVMSSNSNYRCSGYVYNNRCPYDYEKVKGSTIMNSFILPYLDYDGDNVGPSYLSNKFIPKYMSGLKGIFPDVWGWLIDELDKLFRILGNLLLDSFSYIVNRIIKDIKLMLPVVERFVAICVKLLVYLLESLVKIIIVIEKRIFLSEYTIVYVLLAYYMNLEAAPIPLVIILILILGITRWFPSVLLMLLNGEFKTDVVTKS